MNPTGAGMQVRIFDRVSEIRSITTGWRDLFDRSANATPFQSPEWLLPWIEVFSPSDMRFVQVHRQGRLVAVLPLLIYPRGGERVAAFMGGGVSDYLDLLAEPGSEEQAWNAIWGELQKLEGWDLLELTDLPHDSALLRSPALRPLCSEHDICSILELPASREELPYLFSKRQRANLRNARSRSQRAGGARVETATPETAPDYLEDLFRLHTTRWFGKGGPGVLHDEKVRSFHRRSLSDLAPYGILRLHRLRIDGFTAAVSYSLIRQDTVFCYLQGFHPEFSFTSPGTQLMFALIEEAVSMGKKRFDFLRGEENYKRHWRAEPQPTYRIQLRREPARIVASGYPAQTSTLAAQ